MSDIRFRTRETVQGGHVHVDVFVGAEGQGANAGRLVLRPEEAAALAAHLDAGPIVDALEAMCIGAHGETRRRADGSVVVEDGCPGCAARATLRGESVAEEAFEQPKMACPRCRKQYDDFDGFGVLYCPADAGGCGFCQHASADGELDAGGAKIWRCGFCGVMWPDGNARPGRLA